MGYGEKEEEQEKGDEAGKQNKQWAHNFTSNVYVNICQRGSLKSIDDG